MANPTKLTKKVQAGIVARVRAGVAPGVAARAEGIKAPTFSAWLAVGNGRESKHFPNPARYVALVDALDQAMALFECDCIEQLKNPPDDWYDSRRRLDKGHINRLTWMLERTRRERYGIKIQIDDLRDRAAEEVLDRLREGLDAATFDRCVAVLTGEGGAEAPPHHSETRH